MYSKLKSYISFLKYTPLHPQWISYRELKFIHKNLNNYLNGIVLDLGCADKKIESTLPEGCQYIGLDYYKTASTLYSSKPDVFGDARTLPFKDDFADTITLLEVLEHIPEPNKAIQESYRVLKSGGTLVVTVPFMYPIHDAPYDFNRWSKHGLQELFTSNNFIVDKLHYRGRPSETAALLCNIAASKQFLNLCSNYNPLALIALPIIIIIVPLINIFGWAFSFFGGNDDLMPFGYQAILYK